MKRILLIVSILTVGFSCCGQTAAGEPMGFAVCSSLTDATPYPLTGGSRQRSITLVSDGQDMRGRIMQALCDYETVVLDGAGGDFRISSTMRLENMKNRTLRGINNARLCTERVWTEEIHRQMDSLGVKQLSTQSDGTVYTLSNGQRVKEQAEAAVRQILIDYLNDPREHFRQCGILSLVGAENVIVQNIAFQGPGALDISGDDLLNILSGSKHIWVDHCDFADGVDGNLDITTFSDLVTVSWCKFHYTERSYMHMNTNLIGSSDNPNNNGVDALNITYAYCHWGEGCLQRMPMARFGTVHLLNCYYTCANCGLAVNARRLSEMRIEKCFFDAGVMRIFAASSDAQAYQWIDCHFTERFTPTDKGTVQVPYSYTAVETAEVPGLFQQGLQP